MKNKHIITVTVVVFLMIPFFVNAQIQDKKVGIWQIEANYSLQFPDGDIAEHYGVSNTIGAGLTYKTKRNWTIGFEGSYLFGNQIKHGSSMLDPLKTESGHIINRYGEYATISLSQRGFFGGIKLGRVFNVFSHNPNSGIAFHITGGWMHHHIKIENKDNNAPPVLGDYKAGYDRLKGGPALKQFLGYQYLGNNETINFYAGFEFYQAQTKSLRAFNFDTMEADNNQYLDILYGFRFGWIITIYDKEPHRFYHN